MKEDWLIVYRYCIWLFASVGAVCVGFDVENLVVLRFAHCGSSQCVIVECVQFEAMF